MIPCRLRQLTNYSENQTNLLPMSRHVIESGLQSLSIPDFPVPEFPIGKILGVLTALSEKADTKENKSTSAENDESTNRTPAAATSAKPS